MDQRNKSVSITEDGMIEFVRAREQACSLQSEILSCFGGEQRDFLLSCFSRLNDRLEQISDSRGPYSMTDVFSEEKHLCNELCFIQGHETRRLFGASFIGRDSVFVFILPGLPGNLTKIQDRYLCSRLFLASRDAKGLRHQGGIFMEKFKKSVARAPKETQGARLGDCRLGMQA